VKHSLKRRPDKPVSASESNILTDLL